MSQAENQAFILSLIAGVLIVCNAIAVGVAATWFPGIFPTLPGSTNNAEVPFDRIVAIGLICGALVLFGAIMILSRPVKTKTWGSIVIIFSILSVITGGGFLIGIILGIIGGAKSFQVKS
jgi:hypothetical protein